MNLVPLSSVPVEVRKEYALQLVERGVLDGEEALAVTLFPGDTLVPKIEFPDTGKANTHWKAACADCGVTCWTRGGTPRCRGCFNRALAEVKRAGKGFCSNGHPWTVENIYTRPNGHSYCRECSRHYKSTHRKRNQRRYFRVPCSICGEPCCPPEHKKNGLSIPRCRECYMRARRETRAA